MTTTSLPLDAPTTIATDVLARLEAAWNAADGAAFGAVYTDDAHFVTIRGEHFVGAVTIAAGHHGIFTTIYAGSVNRMELVRANAVADGVIVSIATSTLDCPSGPLQGVHRATSTSVLVRDESGSGWKVASTHNTLRAD